MAFICHTSFIPTLFYTHTQFFARGYVEHTRYQRAVRGFRRLQAQWRSSFYKKSYKNLKYQLVRVQSRVRGFLSRKQTMR